MIFDQKKIDDLLEQGGESFCWIQIRRSSLRIDCEGNGSFFKFPM